MADTIPISKQHVQVFRSMYRLPPLLISANMTHEQYFRIVWPFTFDQPLTAIQIADMHQIGYELLEVRSGNGLKPICRTGYAPIGTIEAFRAEVHDVLTKAFGYDGEMRRARLQRVREAMNREWEAGGNSKKSMEVFLDSFQC